MSTVGQIEKTNEQRVVKLFGVTLRYECLGDSLGRGGNTKMELGLPRDGSGTK